MAKNGNGEGSITKRKDGRWQGMISYGRKADGSINRKYYYGKTRKEVSEKMKTAMHEMQSSTYIDTSVNPTIGQWLNEWLWTYKKNNVKQTTFEQYETLIRVHIVPELGDTKLIKLTVHELQQFYNKKAEHLSSRTVHLINAILHEAFKQAILNGYIIRNITEAVVLPKSEHKKIRVFTPEEQRHLINILKKNRYGNAYLFGLFTGMRRGELLAVTWSDYDEVNKTITVNKTLNRVKNYDKGSPAKTKMIVTEPKTEKSNRIIPLLDVAVEVLDSQKHFQEADKKIAGELYADNGLIFCTPIGTLIDPGNFARQFKNFLRFAGIEDATPHTMRHSFATRGLESWISLKVMQELLGHSSVSVTGDIYTHALIGAKRNELEKMNVMFNEKTTEKE